MLKRFLVVVSAALVMTMGASALASLYLGNTKSGKFHYAGCRTIKHPEAAHFVELRTREEAILRGFVPCKVCNP